MSGLMKKLFNNKNEHPVEDENTVMDESRNKNDIFSDDIYNEDTYGEDEEESTGTEDIYSEEDMYNDENSDDTIVISEKEEKRALESLAKNGTSIVITGCTGSGITTIAYNLAKTLSRLGYKTLLVDFDTEHRSQTYISKNNFKCIDKESEDLKKAINRHENSSNAVSFVSRNLYLLGLGISADSFSFGETFDKSKLTLFTTQLKSSYEFIVYDMPIRNIIEYYPEIAMICDKLVLNMTCNTWGVMKCIGKLLNIENEELLDTFFTKSEVLFNRVTGENTVMDSRFNPDDKKWGDKLDAIIASLAGCDLGLYFSDLGKALSISEFKDADNMWFTNRSISDINNNEKVFMELLRNLLLR